MTGRGPTRQRASSVEKAAERLAQLPRRRVGEPPQRDDDAVVADRTADLPRAVEPVSPPERQDEEGNEPRRSRKVSINQKAMRSFGMVTVSSERSVIAEEFRLIKRPLLVKAMAAGQDKVRHGNLIMVTSARPGEGKTFCAVNLAMSIALERDLTVMLVDADVAKPSIASTLGIDTDRGLIDLIADEKLDLADVLLRTDIDKLTVLPAGRSHLLATELLASDRMEQLINEIAARYPDRIIIFDSPPVLMSSVASVLAAYVGQVAFIVQAEKSSESSVDAALGLISSCSDVSLVLNKARDLGGADRLNAYYGYHR